MDPLEFDGTERGVYVKVKLEPDYLGEVIAGLGSDRQALFLNSLAKSMGKDYEIEMQLGYIENDLTEDAKDWLVLVGEWIKEYRKVPPTPEEEVPF